MGDSVYSHLNLAKITYDASASNVTMTNESGTYGKANLFDNQASKPCKTTAASTQITIDLGSAQEVNLLGIINHSITASPSTFSLEYADDSGFSVNNGSIALDRYENDMFRTWATITARYWRLNITLASGTFYIGELWLGKYATMVQPDYSLSLPRIAMANNVETTYGHGTERVFYSRRYLNLQYETLKNETDLDTLDAFMENVKFNVSGVSSPFIFIFDNDITNNFRRDMYCQITNELVYASRNHKVSRLDKPFLLREMARGYIA